MKRRIVNSVMHVVCSLAFLAFPFLISPDWPYLSVILKHPIGLRDVISHVLMVIFFYLNFFYLVPTYYFNKRYLGFYAVVCLFLLIMIVFPFVLIEYFPMPSRHPRPPFWSPFIFIFFNHNLYLFMAVFFVSLLMKTSRQWKLAEKEKVDAELLYLKA